MMEKRNKELYDYICNIISELQNDNIEKKIINIWFADTIGFEKTIHFFEKWYKEHEDMNLEEGIESLRKDAIRRRDNFRSTPCAINNVSEKYWRNHLVEIIENIVKSDYFGKSK